MISSSTCRKLLVVDDEPLIRQTLSMCLRDDYEVTAVASGNEAIEASSREDFPVVILDLCMEGLSGIETLKRLKNIRENQHIIILTAYESTESAISALNYGAFNYLTKPFERNHLKEIIERGFDAYDQHVMRKKEMQQRLMSVHDEFFALLCHEFNTPLNIILGFSDLLSNHLSDPEQVSWADDIRNAGTHLHDILMEIVDYIGASHLALAGVEREFVPSDTLSPLLLAFREKDVTVHADVRPGAKIKLRGQPHCVTLITRKLVSMVSHNGGWVNLKMNVGTRNGHLGQDILHLTVSGPGMDNMADEELERLFEPYQSPVSGNNGRASLGLELATCRKIAEYTRGTVDCVPSGRGGVEFVAEIPVTVLN